MEKKVSYVFLAPGFEEIEALTTVDVLRRAGMPVQMVSLTEDNIVPSAHGVEVASDLNSGDLDFDDLDVEWLICPGGMPGATNIAESEFATDWLMSHYEGGGRVAAICASPAVVLAPLGLLDGKPATCYPGMEYHDCEADWCQDMVVVSGQIVTGRGPASAAEFALTLVRESLGDDVARQVAEGMLL